MLRPHTPDVSSTPATTEDNKFKKDESAKHWILSEKNKSDLQLYAKIKCKKESDNTFIGQKKIVAYTSLSPYHHNTDSQRIAVESWSSLGITVYSFNHPSEAEGLKNKYPESVNFVYSTKTTSHIFGKPCIIISEMIDHFTEKNTGDILMLINSDIILNDPSDILKKIKSISDLGIIIASRNDYKYELTEGKKYNFGFDVFFINSKYAAIYPPAIYSMGQTWWDYWIPYTALKNKVPVFRIEESFAFHKEHPKQYNDKDWYKMTEYFKLENDIIDPDPQKVNNSILRDIMNNSISFNL